MTNVSVQINGKINCGRLMRLGSMSCVEELRVIKLTNLVRDLFIGGERKRGGGVQVRVNQTKGN